MSPGFRIFLAVLAILGLGIGELAFGAQRTVSGTLPTANTDGSALPLSQISSVTVVWGASASALSNSKNIAGPFTAATFTTTIDLAPGTHFIGARVTANGNQSAVSNTVSVVVPQPTPNPPTITVTEVVAGMDHAPVFKLTSTGKRSPEPAGYVHVGEPCTGNVLFYYREKPFRRISAANVKFWNVVPSENVAAPCA